MKKPVTLKALLRDAKLSELAKQSGINVRTLRRIKTGETTTVHFATERVIRQALEQPA